MIARCYHILPSLTSQRAVVYREARAGFPRSTAALPSICNSDLLRCLPDPDAVLGYGRGRGPPRDAATGRGSGCRRRAFDSSDTCCRNTHCSLAARSEGNFNARHHVDRVELGAPLDPSRGRCRAATPLVSSACPDARPAARDPCMRERHPFRPSPEGSPARRGVSGIFSLPARGRPDGVHGDP